jgi:hypothetical protein
MGHSVDEKTQETGGKRLNHYDDIVESRRHLRNCKNAPYKRIPSGEMRYSWYNTASNRYMC